MANLERIKRDISILDIAKDLNLTVIKVGNRSYTLKEYDSVRISPDKNLFMRFSTGEKGSNIDFLMTFAGMSSGEAISYLDNKLKDMGYIEEDFSKINPNLKKEEKKIKKEFVLPQKADTNKNVYAYLSYTRQIDKDIINEFIENNMLYQDNHRNCVFVSYKEDKAVFANLRGTNTNKKFVGDISASDYSYCFFVDNNKHNLVVTESVIDLMSSMNITKIKGEDYKQFDYLALSGTQKIETALNYHLNNKDYKNIILCMDNDDAGSLAIKKAKDLIELRGDDVNVLSFQPLYVKDMNDYLINLKDKNSIEHISMLYEKEFDFMTKKELRIESENLYRVFNQEKEQNMIDSNMSFYDYALLKIEEEKSFFDEIENLQEVPFDEEAIKVLEEKFDEFEIGM